MSANLTPPPLPHTYFFRLLHKIDGIPKQYIILKAIHPMETKINTTQVVVQNFLLDLNFTTLLFTKCLPRDHLH